MRKTKIKRLNQIQFIALGFFTVIIVGMLLLMLPIASRSGNWTNPLVALFTSTSSSCVTGLILVDTYSYWSHFGQIIILILIQIGGLGFISIGVGFSVLFQKHIGLRQRDLLKESVNAIEIGGIIRLWRGIIKGTFIFEGIGAVLLSIRFIPEFGIGRGIYFGIFHSVSAFCNAGFDLMGINGPYISLSRYISDPLVNIVICLLIIIGGLGFMVWRDIKNNKLHWHRYCLHTKIVLAMTAILVVGGTVVFYLVEKDASLKGLTPGTQALASFFGAVTPRTAGFNTIDNAALSEGGKLLSTVLMFIGGSPGSTAGGIKTTTMAILIMFVISKLKNNSGCNIYKRSINDDILKKASVVFMINISLTILATMIILATTKFSLSDVLFETTSAISTVGLTVGITRDISFIGKIVLVLLMYLGRCGSMTFALSIMQNQKGQPVRYPEEKVAIG